MKNTSIFFLNFAIIMFGILFSSTILGLSIRFYMIDKKYKNIYDTSQKILNSESLNNPLSLNSPTEDDLKAVSKQICYLLDIAVICDNFDKNTNFIITSDKITGPFVFLPMKYRTLPVHQNGSNHLKLLIPEMTIDNIHREFRIKIFTVLLLSLPIAIFFAYLLSQFTSKPIKKIIRQLQKHEIQQKNTPIQINSSTNEIQTLTRNVNYLLNRVHRYTYRIRKQKEELGIIINSLNEGLTVINREGRIVIMNKAFQEIFRHQNPSESEYYWYYIRDPKFASLLEKLYKERIPFTDEMEIENHYYFCSFNNMESVDEYIVLFQDITALKNLDQEKKDFISNMTHELKTPLTAISGFTDLIADKKNDDPDLSFKISIIKKHTQRMVAIVQDLLMLSEIETKNQFLNFGPTDINQLIHSVSDLFQNKIKVKNHTFTLYLTDQQTTVQADSFKIEQVFINLIDNAIKYTEENGRIEVRTNNDEDFVYIEIEDNGPGIPDKDQNRIFERFYVVDKSRSRKMGGTGLGLSIVRKILFLHQGNIALHSNPDIKKGTLFVITLPKEQKSLHLRKN